MFNEGAPIGFVLLFLFPSCRFRQKKRATDESRTRDLFLTKEALYH